MAGADQLGAQLKNLLGQAVAVEGRWTAADVAQAVARAGSDGRGLDPSYRAELTRSYSDQIARADAGPITTTTARALLGRNRSQVQRLIDANLLHVRGRYGRAVLLDPAELAVLSARRTLPDTGDSADALYALPLHLGPRERERFPERFDRDYVGWDADVDNDDNQWTGWWNTGTAIAAELTEARLPLLPAVSGFVVDVRIATGYEVHPLYPGLVRFTVIDPTDDERARFSGTVFTPAAGSPWQRLWERKQSER